MHPYLFTIGGFRFPTYGLFTALGYITGAWFFISKRKLAGLKKDECYDLLFWLIIGALAGGKIFYVVTFWNEFGATFSERAIETVKTARYGFVFYGGFLFSALVLFVYSRIRKFNFAALADILAPALALGHAFGRLGCFFAGCCHGKPTDSLFGVVFSNPESLVKGEYLGIPIHPTQLYSSFSNFAIFLILNVILALKLKKSFRDGAVLAFYGLLYSVSRFSIEFFRGDDRGSFIMGLSFSQIFSLAVFTASILFLLKGANEKKNDNI